MKNAATVQGCDDGEIIQSPTTNYEALDKIDNQLETLSMNNAYFVKGCNDGEPEFTEQKPKVHARNKKLKNRCLLLIGPDGNEIPAWTEDLFHLKHAPRTRVIVHKEIMSLLREPNEKLFYLSWANDGVFVYSKL
ncbi:hypothetical protein Tco_0269268 [Tanacetum coccineum]